MILQPPSPSHLPAVQELSQQSAGEQSWAASMLIAQLNDEASTYQMLFGEDVLVALAAVHEGRPVAFGAVHRRGSRAELHVLVAAAQRRHGIATALVDRLFKTLPAGLTVEAALPAENTAAQAFAGQQGFYLQRAEPRNGQYVYIFVRISGDQEMQIPAVEDAAEESDIKG